MESARRSVEPNHGSPPNAPSSTPGCVSMRHLLIASQSGMTESGFRSLGLNRFRVFLQPQKDFQSRKLSFVGFPSSPGGCSIPLAFHFSFPDGAKASDPDLLLALRSACGVTFWRSRRHFGSGTWCFGMFGGFPTQVLRYFQPWQLKGEPHPDELNETRPSHNAQERIQQKPAIKMSNEPKGPLKENHLDGL